MLQLQSTPLVATVTIADAFFVNTKVRQDLLIPYEPLMLLALIYMILTAIVVLIFARLEKLVPIKR